MWTAVLRKELREARWKWLLFAGVLLAIAIAAQAIYGPMREFLSGLGGSGGPGLLVSLQRQLDDPFLYHWGNWYAKNLYQMTTAFVILMGMSAVAGEVSRGTAPYLFTRPMTRWAVLSAKIAGGYGIMAAIMIGTTVALMGITRLGGMALPARFLAGIPMALLGGLVLYLIAVIASILIDDPIKAGAAAAVVMAVLAIPGWIRGWSDYSIFRQMTGMPVLMDRPWSVWPAVSLGAVALLLYLAAGVLLGRKEFVR